MLGALRAIARKLGVVAEAPRMASGFTTGSEGAALLAIPPGDLAVAIPRMVGLVLPKGDAIVYSIFVENLSDSEDCYVIAFDAEKAPKEGTETQSRRGDRHVIKVAAGASETMQFPNGWRLERGLVVVPSYNRRTVDYTQTSGLNEIAVPSIYWNVEFDHDVRRAG